MKEPLVSIAVITYNSSRTVIETLDSIKAQTYPNIELIISDDCSKDDTVAKCQKWVKQNKDQFVRTEIVAVDANSGVSANFNRGEAACRGEWIKPIAGDDVLMPDCIQDCMDYVADHTDTIYLFGKQKAFGASEERCKEIDAVFDYTFFNLTQEQQLHRLVFDGNCVPATTLFFNRVADQKVGIKNDERIPLLEDWPKWINLLRAGVNLHFIDKVLVKYRVGGISTVYRPNPKIYRSGRMFTFLYRFPEWYKADPEKAAERVVDEEMQMYQWLMDSERQLKQIQASKAYRIGKALLKPFKWLKRK